MKRGFTLVELLAVIVLLSVIAVITTPIVLNIVEKSKKESNEISLGMYAKAVDLAINDYHLKEKKYPTSYTEIKDYINYNRSEVECNTFKIYSDGTFYLNNCKVNNILVENYSYGDEFTPGSLAENILNNYGAKISTKEDFSTAPTQNDKGLYKTEDDLGDSYYFYGNPENNYLIFGQQYEAAVAGKICPWGDCSIYSYDTMEACMQEPSNGAPWSESDCIDTSTPEAYHDIYWRIVRINGDGSIRLVYDGLEKVSNGISHTATIDSSIYGSSVDYKTSTIKGILDTWYSNNLEEKYSNYIEDSIFCNDKQNTISVDDASGYTTIYYAAYSRLGRVINPSLKCTNVSDRYTISNKNGNGLLSNPIGLLSADELFLAGGTKAASNNYYLYSGESYWTLTPSYEEAWSENIYKSLSNGSISDFPLVNGVSNDEAGVRPVINLKADVNFDGTGTIDDPYVIVTE